MQASASDQLLEYASELEAALPSPFVPPTIQLRHDVGEGSAADTSRHEWNWLVQHGLSRSKVRTYAISGEGGLGKSTLCFALTSALIRAGQPTLLIGPEDFKTCRLKELNDIDGFLRKRAPHCVQSDRWWNDKIRKDRLVLVVDAVNELYRLAQDEDDRLGIKSLIFGHHKRTSFCFCRNSGDIEASSRPGGREVVGIELLRLSAAGREFFLKECGLEPRTALGRLEDAGLLELSENPHVMSYIIKLLIAAPDSPLPRTRAAIFKQSLHILETKRLNDEERIVFRDNCPLIDIAKAAGLLAAPIDNPDRIFNAREVFPILKKVWQYDQYIERKAQIFFGTYWIYETVTASVTKPAKFQHDRLSDFCLALAFIEWNFPPYFMFDEKLSLESSIADWIGLKDQPTDFVEILMKLCETFRRPEILVEVVTANHGALPLVVRNRIWKYLNSIFIRSRTARLRILDRLNQLSRPTRREFIRNGLMRLFEQNKDVFNEAVETFLEGTFDQKLWQKIVRAKRGLRRRHRSFDSEGFGDSFAFDEIDRPTSTVTEPEKLAGDPDTGCLIERMLSKTSRQETRRASAVVLGSIGDLQAVKPLCDALKDKASNVRGSAATALGSIGDLQAVKPLCDALKDDAPKVRGSAASALASLGDPLAVTPLCNALKDEDPFVRSGAANALGRMGDPGALEFLRDALWDTNPNVAGAAANALGAIGSATVIQDLIRHFRSQPIESNGRSPDLDAIFLLCEDWPDDIAVLFDEWSATKLSKMCKGKLIEGFFKFPTFTDRMRDWLVQTARRDFDPVTRTAAVNALIKKKALDDELLNFLFDPGVPGPLGHKRDTEAGVLNFIARSILDEFTVDTKPKQHKIDMLIDMLSDDGVFYTAKNMTIAHLYEIDLNSARNAIVTIRSLCAGRLDQRLLSKLGEAEAYVESCHIRNKSLQSFIDDRSMPILNDKSRVSAEPPEGDIMETVVIATANKREAVAVTEIVLRESAALGKEVNLKHDPILPHQEGFLPGPGGIVRRACIVRADETGPSEAQDLVRRIMCQLKPNYIFFVGCAALLDERSPPKSDTVFIARRALDADKKELSSGNTVYQMDQYPGDLRIKRNIELLSDTNKFASINLVTNRDFVSSSAFLKDRDASLRKDIVERYPADAVVLEMEAFAVLQSIFRHRSEGHDVAVAVIKGISDFGDSAAQTNKDETQKIATKNAMQVVCTLLQSLP